tara:strand:- start:671 stop:1321 length:651 start_codon:yes stop_codon:yes gene_type:complete
MAEEEQEAPPKWFNEFQTQLAGALGGLNQQQQALSQQVQNAKAEPVAAPQGPSKDTDEKLLNDFVNNPSRFISELDQVITSKAAAHAEEALSRAEEGRRMEDAARKFENDFFSQNPELMPYRALLIEKMQTQSAHLEPMAKAEAAAVEVRNLLKNEQANAIENERRQRVSALRASGAQGLRAALEETGDVASPRSSEEHRAAMFEFEQQAHTDKLG